MKQDSIDVFQNPVDSTRVSAEDITSELITSQLNLMESLHAFKNLIYLEYLFFVCISYYIVVTRIQFIKTNSLGKRNTLMFALIIFWGVVEFLWLDRPFMNILVTGLIVSAAYEFLFKRIFKWLEKIGFSPLPQWHVEEIKQEKQADIKLAEQTKRQ